MHEFVLAQHIVSAILPKVPAGSSVAQINLAIGVLAGVSISSLEFGLEVASRGTLLEPARLNVRSIALTIRCKECGSLYSPPPSSFAEPPASYGCPDCGAGIGAIETGREMEIESIELS